MQTGPPPPSFLYFNAPFGCYDVFTPSRHIRSYVSLNLLLTHPPYPEVISLVFQFWKCFCRALKRKIDPAPAHATCKLSGPKPKDICWCQLFCMHFHPLVALSNNCSSCCIFPWSINKFFNSNQWSCSCKINLL